MHSFVRDGLALAYIDVPPIGPDRREPVLLIHGFASNHAVNWVNTLWVKTLTTAGRRVIAFDNRGHGESGKRYDPADYAVAKMAADAAGLLDHLGLGAVDVMGYSMGGRITAYLAAANPERVRSAILGGIGIHLVEGVGLPTETIAEALSAPSLDRVTDPVGRMFRAFAGTTRSDLRALTACIRGSRQLLDVERFAAIAVPMLVCVGTTDTVAGDPHALVELARNARAVDIPDRDHNLAVGDKVFKQAVLAFLESRP